MPILKKLYTHLYEVDPTIYEKEELIQNLINSLGFEFGPLYDFNSIFQLLKSLLESDLKDKIYDYFRLISIILKYTLKLLSQIKQGQKISPNYSKKQQDKLLFIQSEFFQEMLKQFNSFFNYIKDHAIFKEYTYQLFLSIPIDDLNQNLKETQFKSFSKLIAEDIYQTLTCEDKYVHNKSQSLGLVFNCFSALQFFLNNTTDAYRDHFISCKEKVIKFGILQPTETLHEIIVQENETSLDLNEIQEEYTYLFIKLFSCTNLITQLDDIYQITEAATSTTSSDDTCIYTFACLGLQLDFYLNVLRIGLNECSNQAPRLQEYINYRPQVLKQLWIFLREEKKKAIKFNLEPSEYTKIVYKSYLSTIEGLNFISNSKFKNLPLYLKYNSDDQIFYALTEYISYYAPSNQNEDYENGQKKLSKSKSKNKKMVAEGEENEEKEEVSPINEKVLIPIQHQMNNKDITDIQLILLNFCTLTLNNPKYIYSHFGIYIFKNFFDSENKEIVEILRKNIAASRLYGNRSNGYPPFWKCFDIILNQFLDEKEDLAHIRKFITFIHKAYFSEAITDHLGATRKAKDHIRELCERKIYYLTAATSKLFDNQHKLSTLDCLGFLLSFKINFPKQLDPEKLLQIQNLQKKFHTFFLKKVQDSVKEFKDNNQHLQSFENTILSDTSKSSIYRFVKHLETWSGVKLNVDPYGEGEQNLNEQRKHAEASIKKEKKNSGEDDEDNDERESDNESGSDSDEEENSSEKKRKSKYKESEKSKMNTRSSSGKKTKDQKQNSKSSKKMEAEQEKPVSKGTQKTKRQDRKESTSRDNKRQEEKKQDEVKKKNFRRQPNKN